MSGKEAYRAFESSQTVPLYQQSWFLDRCTIEGDWDAVYLLEDKNVVAVLPYFHKSKLGLRYITMPPLVKYMSPLFDNAKTKEKRIAELFLLLPKTSMYNQQWDYSFDKISHYFSFPVHEIWRDTYVWNLSDHEDESLASMNGNYRRAIKKYASDFSCDLRQKSKKEDHIIFWNLLEKSLGENPEKHDLSFKMVSKLIEELENKEKGKLLILYKGDGVVAASLVGYDSDVGYYFLAGNDPQFNKYYPGVQMVWKSRQFLVEQTKVKTVDFMGSSLENIAKVWKKMGAQQKKYPNIRTNPSPIFALLNKSKNIFTKK